MKNYDEGPRELVDLNFQELFHIRAGLFLVMGTLASNHLSNERGRFLEELISKIETRMRYIGEQSND